MACLPDNTPKNVVLSTQTQCAECRFEIQSMLRRVQGVYSVSINADRNTITVSGNSAPQELLQTLLKVSQDCEFCIKPPAHIRPSSCPANRRTCSSWPQLQLPACSSKPSFSCVRVCSDAHASMPPFCACNQRTAAACYRACGGYQCHAPQYPCHSNDLSL